LFFFNYVRGFKALILKKRFRPIGPITQK